MQKMIRPLDTKRGKVVIREANLTDAVQFRDLRLSALLDCPTAFSADYQVTPEHPMSYWEYRSTIDANGTIFSPNIAHRRGAHRTLRGLGTPA